MNSRLRQAVRTAPSLVPASPPTSRAREASLITRRDSGCGPAFLRGRAGGWGPLQAGPTLIISVTVSQAPCPVPCVEEKEPGGKARH